MAEPLIIVESPTKARTIERLLKGGFKVVSSYGHVRDLPTRAAEIPAALKKEKWSRIGINIEADFKPLYIVPADKKKHLAKIKNLLRSASELLLATDEDREGESISWHLLEVLQPKIPFKRMVFHEITDQAIRAALSAPRGIDLNLVKAQETRRIVDRLFGYLISPLLWKKMGPRLSAGRVQSVAMRLLVERERERMRFKSATYWDIKGSFRKIGGAGFSAQLAQIGGRRVADGKDFDPISGRPSAAKDVVFLDEAQAKDLQRRLSGLPAQVAKVELKPYTTRPYPPFVTSTLQQEAARKLRFPVRRTMQIAQQLYENGFITYMRTDSTTLSDEALRGAREVIARDFGEEYLPPAPRLYKTQVKNAQEAHEAIRPAGAEFAPPQTVKDRLGAEAFRLYELIWKRTLASQMKDARGTRIAVDVGCGDAIFRAAGKTIEFPGYLRAYVEGSDEPDAELASQEVLLPELRLGEALETEALEPQAHATQPPPRFTEGSLIKELERLGIGRPSTWATIVDLVLSRTYAFKKGTALVPTFLALALTNLMERYFPALVDYSWTASLEDELDAISRGEEENLVYLKKFYHGNGRPGLADLVSRGEAKIDPREVCGIPLGVSADGAAIEVRIGRFGPFLTDGVNRVSLPKDLPPDELTLDAALNRLAEAQKGPHCLGHTPAGEPVYKKQGRFGPYVQLGDGGKGASKPKMAGLLPGMTPESVDLNTALALLSLPRVLGINPANQKEVTAANGRFGPYVKCGAETRSIPADGPSPLTITLAQALDLLAQPKQRGRTAKPSILKEIGRDPDSGRAIVLKSGRYGPYVTDGEVNAALPKDAEPAALDMAQAQALLMQRAERIRSDEASGIARGKKRKRAASAKSKPAKSVSKKGKSGALKKKSSN